MSEVNTPNDDKWKDLQRKSLAKCAKGDHEFLNSSKCVICGKENEC